MTNPLSSFPRLATQFIAPLIMASLLGFGCATLDSTNWDERVGTYNIEDAKAELGTPDETEDLPNGGVRATWIERISYRPTRSLDTGSSYDPRTDDQTGVNFTPQNVGADAVLDLTFNDDGILTGWQTATR